MARHTYLCPMRWSDMDAYQHVNNVVFLRYLEEARVDLLLNAAGEKGRAMLDTGVLVARHEIDYKAPLVFRSAPVPIELWTERIDNGSFTVGYEVVDDDESGRTVYAVARTVLVPFDNAAGHTRRVSADDKEWLERFAL
jgi:acyl-CoA thioester hydrolase